MAKQILSEEFKRMQKLAGIITENNLPKDIKVTKDEDEINIQADSGDYVGFIEDGKVSFSITYDDLDEGFDEDNWRDILGDNHAFVKIIDSIGGDVEAIDDYVMITVDASKIIYQLADDKLAENNPNAPDKNIPSDVANLAKAQGAATGVASRAKNINIPQEFPGAFKVWFKTLGYEPGKIGKGAVRASVDKVLTDLGFK